MRSDRGNNVAKSCANTDARGRLAIRRRYFIEEISPPFVLLHPTEREKPSGANVVERRAMHHGDSLKDILDDRLSRRANNRVDTRASGGGKDESGKRIPSSLECIIKIPRDRSARAHTNTHTHSRSPFCLFCLVPR